MGELTGASKQPQQTAILNYFTSIGQKFDYVIAVDGVNELSVPPRNLNNNISGNYPFGGVIGGFAIGANMSQDVAEYLVSFKNYRQKVNTLSTFASESEWIKSNLIKFLVANYFRFITNQFNKSKSNLSELRYSSSNDSNSLQIPGPENISGLESIIRYFLKNQVLASKNMEAISKANGAVFIQALQPNQYYSKKIFSDAELKLAIWESDQNVVAKTIRIGYPQMKKAYNSISNYLDLTGIFDKTKEIIYVDNCCHFNKLGNDVMAENISDYITKISK